MQNILAGHTNSYHTYTLDQALEGISKAGFKYVELSAVRGWTEHVPLEPVPSDLREIKAKLDHYDLSASALSGHSDLTTAEGLVDAKKAVDLCVQLGLKIMNTAVGGHYSEGENKEAFMSYIHELADYAAARGVDVSLEVHGDIMATGQMSIPLIHQINRPNVGINYDTANCVFYGAVEACDDIRPVVPYLKHVHLKDKRGGPRVWDFPAVGEGHVNFWGLFKILQSEHYQGPFSVEIEFTGLPWPPLDEVNRSMAVSYSTLSELGLK